MDLAFGALDSRIDLIAALIPIGFDDFAEFRRPDMG